MTERATDAEVEAALRAARAKIDALCSGEERWAMSIPARRDHDHDLVISYALTLAERALAAKDAEIERLEIAKDTEVMDAIHTHTFHVHQAFPDDTRTGAELIRALIAERNDFRAALAAKDAEIERLKDCVAHDLQRWGWAEDEIKELRADVRLLVEKGSKIADDRDAAESRGFREAAEWLEGRADEEPDFLDRSGLSLAAFLVRTEADRREGNVSTGEGES